MIRPSVQLQIDPQFITECNSETIKVGPYYIPQYNCSFMDHRV